MKIGQKLSKGLADFFDRSIPGNEPLDPPSKSLFGGLKQPEREIIRLAALTRLTTPNWDKYLPQETAGKKGNIRTFIDTETDDRNRILTIAAVKARFNYNTMRFERAEGDTGFFRVYDPVNVNRNVVRTQGKHGLAHIVLDMFRHTHDVSYGDTWNQDELEQFRLYAKGTELIGHNIVTADIPWMLQKSFNPDTAKYGFFDTLHFAKAVVGKQQSAALQDLVRGFGIKGLKEHEASSDVIANIKVFEQLIRRNPNNPAVAEALYALQTPGVQTHWLEPAHLEEGSGYIIHGARGKPLKGLPYEGADIALKGFSATKGYSFSEPVVLDIKDAFDIPQDVYDNVRGTSNFLKANYLEDPMSAGDNLDIVVGAVSDLARRLDTLYALKPSISSEGLSSDKDMQRVIRYVRTKVSTAGLNADSPLLDIPSDLADSMTTQLRSLGYNPSDKDVYSKDSLYQRIVRRALQENAYDAWKKQVTRNETAANLLAKDATLYSAEPWYQKFANIPETELSQGDIDTYRENRKNHVAAKVVAKKAEQVKKKAQQTWYDKLMSDIDTLKEEESERKGYQAEQIRQFEEEQRAENSRIFSLGLRSRLEKEQKTKETEEHRREVAQRQAEDFRLYKAKQAVANRLDWRDAREQTAVAVRRGDLFKGYAEDLSKVTSSTADYRKELQRLTERTNTIKNVWQQFARDNPIFNPMQLVATINAQGAGIQNAARHILPGAIELPAMKFSNAVGNVWQQKVADWQFKLNTTSRVAKAIGTFGGAALGALTGNPAGIAVGATIGNGIAGFISQIAGSYAKKRLTEMGEGIQHRLNLVGMATTALRGFIGGLRTIINLFGRLGSVLSYMPSYTLHTLTGVGWNRAQPMQAADNLVGLQAGTISSMYNNLAFQQADLYTSGIYDEKKLVAAARLGIFDLAYGQLGGDVEAQQGAIYDRLYRQLYESNISDADRQATLSLIKNYDPNLVSMLERGHGLVAAGHGEFRNYAAFSSANGRNFLSAHEDADVSVASMHWDLDRRSMRELLSLAGSKAYELAEPLIKALENGLWAFVRGERIDMDAIKSAAKKMFKQLTNMDFDSMTAKEWNELASKMFAPLNRILEGIDWKSHMGWIEPFVAAMVSKASEYLGKFTELMNLTKLEFHPEKLVDLLLGKPVTAGELLSMTSPDMLGEEAASRATSAAADARNRVTQGQQYTNTWRELNKDVIAQKLYDVKTTFSSKEVKHLGGKEAFESAWTNIGTMLAAASPDEATYESKLSAAKSLATSYADLLAKHDITVLQPEKAREIIVSKAAKYVPKDVLSETEMNGIIQQLIVESLLAQGWKATLQSAGGALQAVFSNAAEAGKTITININDNTQAGIQGKLDSFTSR